MFYLIIFTWAWLTGYSLLIRQLFGVGYWTGLMRERNNSTYRIVTLREISNVLVWLRTSSSVVWLLEYPKIRRGARRPGDAMHPDRLTAAVLYYKREVTKSSSSLWTINLHSWWWWKEKGLYWRDTEFYIKKEKPKTEVNVSVLHRLITLVHLVKLTSVISVVIHFPPANTKTNIKQQEQSTMENIWTNTEQEAATLKFRYCRVELNSNFPISWCFVVR
jgi:hypothetical protein